jgi:hypothetical protein
MLRIVAISASSSSVISAGSGKALSAGDAVTDQSFFGSIRNAGTVVHVSFPLLSRITKPPVVQHTDAVEMQLPCRRYDGRVIAKKTLAELPVLSL